MRPKDNWKKTSAILKQDHVLPFFCISVESTEFPQIKKKKKKYIYELYFLQSQTNEFITIRVDVQQKSSTYPPSGI